MEIMENKCKECGHVIKLTKKQEIEQKIRNGESLRNTNLVGADLVGANLRNANLVGSDLEGANLRNTNLVGAKTEMCKVNFAKVEYKQAKQFIEGLK